MEKIELAKLYNNGVYWKRDGIIMACPFNGGYCGPACPAFNYEESYKNPLLKDKAILRITPSCFPQGRMEFIGG
jgi:hypothetical protein